MPLGHEDSFFLGTVGLCPKQGQWITVLNLFWNLQEDSQRDKTTLDQTPHSAYCHFGGVTIQLSNDPHIGILKYDSLQSNIGYIKKQASYPGLLRKYWFWANLTASLIRGCSLPRWALPFDSFSSVQPQIKAPGLNPPTGSSCRHLDCSTSKNTSCYPRVCHLLPWRQLLELGAQYLVVRCWWILGGTVTSLSAVLHPI